MQSLNLNNIMASHLSPKLEQAPAASKDEAALEAEAIKDAEIMQSAKDFEAAYIGQMLKFSGLADALTMNGGEDVSAFADFYIESYSEKIAESGGFGLADRLYESMKKMQEEG